MRWVEGIQDLLDAVHVLTGAGELVLVDLRLGTGALDLRHRIRAQQDEASVLDLEVVAVESADRRPGRAVALGVVLAAVTGAAEARGLRLVQLNRPVGGRLLLRLAHRPVRLHRAAEMGAPVRDDGEARYLRVAGLHGAV